MAHTIDAFRKGVEFNPSGPYPIPPVGLYTNSSPSPDTLGRELNDIALFLTTYNQKKSEDELANETLYLNFEGIKKSVKHIASQVNLLGDCKFASLPLLNSTQQEVNDLDHFYTNYKASKEVEEKIYETIQTIQQQLISLPISSSHPYELIPSRFRPVIGMLHSAKNTGLGQLPCFNGPLQLQEYWVQEIIDHSSLLPDNAALENNSQNPFILFCEGILAKDEEKIRQAYQELPLNYQKKFDLTQNPLNFALFFKNLKEQLLPTVIEEINTNFSDNEHFYKIVRDLGCQKNIVPGWDREWGKTNLLSYSNQVTNNPHLVVNALFIYNTHQINNALFAIWRQLLLNTNVSEPLAWPVCTKLLHVLKTQPILLDIMIGPRKGKIYQYSKTSPSMLMIIDEFTLRASAYMSLSNLATKLPSCCPLLEQLRLNLHEVSETILNFPSLFAKKQRDHLEFARDFFLQLPTQAAADRYNGADVNYLIELVLGVLTEFFKQPDESKVDPSTISNLAKIMDNREPEDSNVVSLETPRGTNTFLPCPEETARRVETATRVGAAMSLPMMRPVVLQYSSMDIPHTLAQIAKNLREKNTMTPQQAFETFNLRMEELPKQCTNHIKRLLGVELEGVEGKDKKVELYLNEIPKLNSAEAHGRWLDVARVIEKYLQSPELTETNNEYIKQKRSFTGLLFPSFEIQRTIKNWQRLSFPTTCQHVYCLFNLITANHPPKNISQPQLIVNVENAEVFRFVEFNQYFSSAKPSLENLPIHIPVSTLLMKVLIEGGILHKVEKILNSQTELAFGPLDAAKKRLTCIEGILKDVLDKKREPVTPHMIYKAIFGDKGK
jgi:hypothetical protein